MRNSFNRLVIVAIGCLAWSPGFAFGQYYAPQYQIPAPYQYHQRPRTILQQRQPTTTWNAPVQRSGSPTGRFSVTSSPGVNQPAFGANVNSTWGSGIPDRDPRFDQDYLQRYLLPEDDWDVVGLPRELLSRTTGEQFLRFSGFARDDGILRGRGTFRHGASVGFRWYPEAKDFITVAFGNGQLTENAEPANGVGLVFDPPKREVRVMAYAAGGPPTVLETLPFTTRQYPVRQDFLVAVRKGEIRFRVSSGEGERPLAVSVPPNLFSDEFRPLLIRKVHEGSSDYYAGVSRLFTRPLPHEYAR